MMKAFRREYSRNAARDFLSRGVLSISLALLASSQLAVALMFWHAHQLRVYPFGAPSGVNGVGHWDGDVFKSLLGAACALAALGRNGNDRRTLALVGLSFVCALILFGVTLVMFCD